MEITALTQPLVSVGLLWLIFIVFLTLFVYLISKINSLSKRIPNTAISLKDQLQAHQQAQAIVEQANQQASAILADSQNLKAVLEKRLMENFEQVLAHSKVVADGQVTLFNQHIEQMMIKTQNEHILALDKMLSDLSAYLKSQSDSLMKQMEDHVMAFGREDRTYMEAELKKIKAELDLYRKEELNKVTNNIYEILARTSETVLGRAVDLDLHQDLIIKALEQAKRDGVFI